ncbi:MAG: hypothetical protein Q8R81_09400 [Novosphingobium sp.]|uniref:hypothetical protein n=1 Tax=Novosphingobium sp. TaxID=1874826 RepID=UPI0027367439|nr:hypothetical protein [Novosphingobium sp.]MDP3550599.1 hypothetical protein [Novosphingobium sp.]
MTILIKSPNVSTAAGLKKFRLDPLLDGDNGGVKFLFDFPSKVGWPGQDAPTNGDVVKNVATTPGLMELGDGAMNIVSGQTPAFAGGGIDFNGSTNDPIEVVGPVGSLSSIAAADNDYFLICCYMRMPSSGDWNTSGSLAPLFCTTSGSNGWTTPEADLLTIAMQSAGILTIRRQTAGATAARADIAMSSNFYGQFCQIVAWRNAAGMGIRIKSDLAEQTGTAVVGSNNSEDFSAKQPRWGIPNSFNGLSGTAAHRATHKTRLYRGWIEDLSQSGRNPLTVADADWTRVQARKTASGDTIFV